MARVEWYGDTFYERIKTGEKAAIDELMQMVKDDAHTRAPFDPNHKGSEPHLNEAFEIVPATPTGSGYSGGVENTNSYFLPVELGHVTRSGSQVPPEPSLRPAFDAMLPHVLSVLKKYTE